MSFRFHLITNAKSLTDLAFARAYPNSLVLAQLCDDPKYVQAIKNKIARGHRIILDNGAHEGIDIDLNLYKRLTLELQPTVVVLTDLVGRPYMDSREQSLKFVRMFDPTELPNTQFMYVPQGQTKDQVLYDYQWAMDHLDPKRFVLGLGQGYLCWVDDQHDVNDEDTRVPMVESVMTLSDKKKTKHEYHVLGARWSAGYSDYQIYEEITGIDTIKPCTCTAFNILYPERPPRGQRAVDRASSPAVDEDRLMDNVAAFCAEYNCIDELDGDFAEDDEDDLDPSEAVGS